MATRFITAVLLNSKNPDRLAEFYRDVLEVPLEVEEHGGGPKHYGCELGDLHFAIHPLRDAGEAAGAGAVNFALQVFDLDGFLEKLSKAGVHPLSPPGERGFARMTAVLDPDGNKVYLTQLSDRWLNGIEERRKSREFDIVREWQARKG